MRLYPEKKNTFVSFISKCHQKWLALQFVFFHSERFEGLGLGCLVPFAIMIGFQELFLKRCGLKLL